MTEQTSEITKNDLFKWIGIVVVFLFGVGMCRSIIYDDRAEYDDEAGMTYESCMVEYDSDVLCKEFR